VAVIGVGIGATVAAAGAGVVLVVLGTGKVKEQEKYLPDVEGMDRATKEREWMDLERSRADLLNAGTWSFIGAGVLGAATVVYALTGIPGAAEPQKAGQIRVYPMATGIEVLGRW
jgi:hypothetical protein